MPFPTMMAVPWLLLVGLLLPRRRDAALAAGGALLASLAVASAALVLGDVAGPDVSRRIAERGVQPDYLLYNAALLLAGCGLVAVAIVQGLRTAPRRWHALAALALVLALSVAQPLLQPSRLPLALLVAATMILVLLAWAEWSEDRGTPARWGVVRAWLAHWSPATAWGVAALAIAAALVPYLGVALLLLAVLAVMVHVRAPRRRAIDRLPVMPLIALAAVVTAGVACRSAGSDGLEVGALADAAFSPALQTLLGVLLLPVLLAFAGVPPFDRFVPGAAFAPVAAALLVRVVLPGLADGVEHWRSALALWLVLGAADAVRRRRAPLVASCASLLALLAGGTDAAVPGMTLALLASAGDVVPAVRERVPAWSARAAVAATVIAWAMALRTSLAAEVVYSVAMTTALVAGMLRGEGRPAKG